MALPHVMAPTGSSAFAKRVLDTGFVPAEVDRVAAGHRVEYGFHTGAVLAGVLVTYDKRMLEVCSVTGPAGGLPSEASGLS